MRVVHVATSLGGGAGLAALRICEAQQSVGIDAHILTLGRRDTNYPAHIHAVPTGLGSRSLGRLNLLLDRALTRQPSIFFGPFSHPRLELRHIMELEPDVLQVHNWFNFFDWSLAPELRLEGVPVVATLHDQRLMTGGCHYTLDCQQIRDCMACPQSRLPRLSSTHHRAAALRRQVSESRAGLVAPSMWLTSFARTVFPSPYNDTVTIPNCIPGHIFSPKHRKEARRIHEADEHEIVIAMIAGKAPELTGQTLRALGASLHPRQASRVRLMIAGDSAPVAKYPMFHQTHVGHLASEIERARFWASADIALAPTTADNFPNVVLEAMASGVPMVTPRVGGAGEALKSGGGIATDPDSPEALSAAVATLICQEDLRDALGRRARAIALDSYSYRRIGERYREFLGNQLAKQRRT